ncbi:MAG: DUF5916 domain-containing protein [Acidobacteriota bacterium]|nr:DUF5916 domain-containing protein [Acidobacteriota bacterium]
MIQGKQKIHWHSSHLLMWSLGILLSAFTGQPEATSLSQNKSQNKKTTAIYIESPITVDGELDESEWSLAKPVSDFLQQEPNNGELSTERTEVRILYDTTTLYLGVYCFDSAGKEGLVVNDVNRDFFQFDTDSFGVLLDTFDDNRNGFLFNTNPQGAKFDSQVGGDGSIFNREWNAIWYVKSKITNAGWQLEIAIPFKSLRFGKKKIDSWGINFQRRIRRKNEDAFWVLPPRPFSMARVSLAGTLEGIQTKSIGPNLSIKPYLSAPIVQAEADDVDFQPEVGLDIKYGLTSQLTLDISANTDFAQVEADNQQINLTRFSLFFPEKREFFLENAPIFQFGRQGGRFRRVAGSFEQVPADVIPFFSRRIGISESRLVPVLGGARVTGRTGHYTLGIFSMQTDDHNDDPSTNFSVVRIRRDILKSSDIGGLFINKHAASDRYNRTYGVDANLNFARGLDLTSYVLKTETPGINNKDMAGSVSLAWTDSKIEAEAQHTVIGENFNPEVGFVPRVGIEKSMGRFSWAPRPGEKIPWIRSFVPIVEANYITDDERMLLTRKLETRLWMEFQNGSRLSVARQFRFERLTEPFFIRPTQMIPVGDYPFSEYSLIFNSDSSRMLSIGLRATTGNFFDGERDVYRFQVIFRKNYRFEARITWDHNDLRLPSGDFSTDLIIARTQYSFSNNLFLKGLIQYNSAFNQISSNIRFNFIHRPLSDFFLIYNEKRSTKGEVFERALIAKLTYTFSF